MVFCIINYKMTVSIRMFKISDYKRILEFYKRVDSEYFPRLSERIGGIEGHILNIINNNGNFCLYEVDNTVEGVAGWLPLDKNREVLQFTFFSFSQRFRNTIAPYRLARYLADKREEYGYRNTKKVIVRTWYEESADKLSRIGMKKVAIVKGDITPERTSYYFEGNLDFIIANIYKKQTVKKVL